MTQIISQCDTCRHIVPPPDGEPDATCPAYPAGIPDPIRKNTVRHNKVLEGQAGTVTWEPGPGIPADAQYGASRLPAPKEEE